MKKIVTLSFLSLMCVVNLLPASMAQPDMREDMLQALDVIKQAYKFGYAPAKWKKEHLGWDLDKQIDAAKKKVIETSPMEVRDFHQILVNFFNNTQDHHCGIWFTRTEEASLPFRIRGAKGRYFVTWVDKKNVPDEGDQLTVGDEVLQFDGKSIHKVIKHLHEKLYSGLHTETYRRIAEVYLTRRVAAFRTLPIPKGSVQVVAKRGKKKTTYTFDWDYEEEKVRSADPVLLSPSEQEGTGLAGLSIFRKKMQTPLYDLLCRVEAENEEEEPDDQQNLLGSRKSFVPYLGEVIWESAPDYPLHAYIYQTPNGKTVGYVRIPRFSSGCCWCACTYAHDLMGILEKMAETTDALVIDQVNNPGGYVFPLYAMASMLSDTPLDLPQHCEALEHLRIFMDVLNLEQLESVSTDEEAQDFFGGPDIDGYPVDFELACALRRYLQFQIDEWEQGKSFTSPFPIFGIEQIEPHPEVRYTKPILVLVNGLAFSGGDFFPAILQDNQRAAIFGTRTAGAGGFLSSMLFPPNHLAIGGMKWTASIAERPDGNPIENLGVTPDIEYHITPQDLQYGYEGYIKAVNKAVDNLISK